MTVDQGTSATDVCTVSGSTVTFDHAATARSPGAPTARRLPGPPDVTQTFDVGKGSQSISFTPPASATVGRRQAPSTRPAAATRQRDQRPGSPTPNGGCTVSGRRSPATSTRLHGHRDRRRHRRLPGAGQRARASRSARAPRTFTFTLPATGKIGGGETLGAPAATPVARSRTPWVRAVAGVCAFSDRPHPGAVPARRHLHRHRERLASTADYDGRGRSPRRSRSPRARLSSPSPCRGAARSVAATALNAVEQRLQRPDHVLRRT